MEFVKELPPLSRNGRAVTIDYDRLAEELRAHPGQWASVRETKIGSNVGGNVLGRLMTRGEGFEVTQRRDVARGVVVTFARWVAPEDGE